MTDSAPARFELRPMGIGDILDNAFRLYRAQFVPFLTISLIVYVPYTILLLLIGLTLGGETHTVQTLAGPREVPSTGTATGLAALLFGLVVWPLVQGALTYHISAGYLGEQLSAVESYRRAAGRLLSLLGTQILAGLVVGLGCLLLIVPGIIFWLWFIVVPPVVLLERIGGTKALSRSRALMKGNLGKGFLLMLVVTVLNAVAMGAVGFMLTHLGLTNTPLHQAVTNLLQGVLLPIITAPAILLYYDLRIRKEGFDLERLSATLAGTPATL